MTAQDRHPVVKARELRRGDLIRIGVSTNYILVHDIDTSAGDVAVWAYDGAKRATLGPALRFLPGDDVELAMRGLR